MEVRFAIRFKIVKLKKGVKIMKDYVEPKLDYILLTVSDVITTSNAFLENEVEFDVTDWLGGGFRV